MDKLNKEIINKLFKLCGDGSYKVFEWQELEKSFGLKKDTLMKNFDYLKNYEFIDTKYSDDTEVCLCVLAKSREIEDQKEIRAYGHKAVLKLLFLSGLFSGILAFLGAFSAYFLLH